MEPPFVILNLWFDGPTSQRELGGSYVSPSFGAAVLFDARDFARDLASPRVDRIEAWFWPQGAAAGELAWTWERKGKGCSCGLCVRGSAGAKGGASEG